MGEGEVLLNGGSETEEEGEFLPMSGKGGAGERIGSSDGREGGVLPHCRCLCGAQD